MILVDTSVWIELLAGKKHALSERQIVQFVTCGPVMQEVFQGLRPGLQSDAFRSAFLAFPVLSDPLPGSLFLAAAEIYRSGRRRGLTIRSSTDCLIAAIAIDNGVPVWHRDRDFEMVARYTGLETVAWS
jgi:predicted nucleic acid-binding protein